MAYGVITRIPAPIEAYDASSAEMAKSEGKLEPDGLILHVARATDDGFELIEVWQSKEHSDKFNDGVVRPALVRLGVSMSPDGPMPQIVEFDASRVIVSHRH
jgi:hypothetical protein